MSVACNNACDNVYVTSRSAVWRAASYSFPHSSFRSPFRCKTSYIPYPASASSLLLHCNEEHLLTVLVKSYRAKWRPPQMHFVPMHSLPWPHDSARPVAESPPAHVPCAAGKAFKDLPCPFCTWRSLSGGRAVQSCNFTHTHTHTPTAGAAATGQHAHTGDAVPCLCRPSPSLRDAGGKRPHRPAAAAPGQRPPCLPAPGRRPGQTAGQYPLLDSSDMCGGGGSPAYAHPQCLAAHT
eukprot:363428-Chlamydomonas_euryale.AAC.6